VPVEDGGGDIGSCPKSELGVMTGAGAGAATGATLLGFATRGFAALVTAFLAGGAALAAAFFGAAFLAFFATFAGLLGFFGRRAFFFAALLLAAGRFAFATDRFFPLPFFFAMISLLLGVVRLLAMRVAPKKSAVICA
jgi:hypothetical protein